MGRIGTARTIVLSRAPAVLVCLNPLVLALLPSPRSILLLLALTMLWHVSRRLSQAPFRQAGVLTGLTLAVLPLAAPSGRLFLFAALSGLVALLPRRLFHRHPAAFALTLLLPAAMTLGALAYLQLVTGVSLAAAPVMPADTAWHRLSAGYFLAGVAAAMLTAPVLAPATVLALWRAPTGGQRRHAGFMLWTCLVAAGLIAQFSAPAAPALIPAAILTTSLAAPVPASPVFRLLLALAALPAGWLILRLAAS